MSNDKQNDEIRDRKLAEDALRNSEKKYQLLMEQASDGIFIADKSGNYIDVNSKACEMLGYTREELLHLNIEHIVFSKDFIKVPFRYDELSSSNTIIGERYLRRKDGSFISVAISAKMLPDGRLQEIVLGITDCKKLEEDRIKAQKLESLGVLAGGLANEFNNFLTAILGNINLSMLILGPNNEAYRALENAEKVLMRAKDLTRQLLTFSKVGPPVKEILSTRELLKESVSFALMGSNVKCVYNISNDLWPVEANYDQMRQVINNLVINACQAMPQGGKIHLFCKNVVIKSEVDIPLKEGQYVKISLKDHGVGIPKEEINKIFDPYYTSKVNENGLGLTTIYSIIKRHEGIITVESKVGIGTTFYIYLPASQKEFSKKIKRDEDIIFGKGRILIMDDDKWVLDVLAEMLKILGYESEYVGDGEDAIKLYKKEKETGKQFDAIIMDLTIKGGMGGKEAIKKLLDIDHNAKVIVSSGYSNDSIMNDYKKYGFSNILTKPYMIQELSKVLYVVITEGN